jgi:hypothetical protein
MEEGGAAAATVPPVTVASPPKPRRPRADAAALHRAERSPRRQAAEVALSALSRTLSPATCPTDREEAEGRAKKRRREGQATPARSRSSSACAPASRPAPAASAPPVSSPAASTRAAQARNGRQQQANGGPAAAAGSAAAKPPPPPLFQDGQFLRKVGAATSRADTVVLRVPESIEKVLLGGYVRRSESQPNAPARVSLPPQRLHTARARVYLRRRLGLSLPSRSLPQLPGATAAARAALSSDEVQRHIARVEQECHVGALAQAVYGCDSISILRPASGVVEPSFSFRLSYAHAELGRAAVAAFEASARSAASSSAAAASASATASGAPLLSVAHGMERFVCGVIRKWPSRFTPSEEELCALRVKVGAKDLLLVPVMRELSFQQEVQFAVPVRSASQLELLRGEMPTLRILKKVKPTNQVCSKCWKEGHSSSRCSEASPLCKHCAAPGHKGDACEAPRAPCLLCKKPGHCVTSCSLFRAQLVPMEVGVRKAEFVEAAADFPALPVAASPVAAANANGEAVPAAAAAVNAGWTTVVSAKNSKKPSTSSPPVAVHSTAPAAPPQGAAKSFASAAVGGAAPSAPPRAHPSAAAATSPLSPVEASSHAMLLDLLKQLAGQFAALSAEFRTVKVEQSKLLVELEDIRRCLDGQEGGYDDDDEYGAAQSDGLEDVEFGAGAAVMEEEKKHAGPLVHGQKAARPASTRC